MAELSADTNFQSIAQARLPAPVKAGLGKSHGRLMSYRTNNLDAIGPGLVSSCEASSQRRGTLTIVHSAGVHEGAFQPQLFLQQGLQPARLPTGRSL